MSSPSETQRERAVNGPSTARLLAAGVRAGVPFAIAPGNHDTRAVGWNGHGGSGRNDHPGRSLATAALGWEMVA